MVDEDLSVALFGVVNTVMSTIIALVRPSVFIETCLHACLVIYHVEKCNFIK